jgi:hypothetical protein
MKKLEDVIIVLERLLQRLTDIDGIKVGELVLLIYRPRKKLRGLAHGSGVNPILGSIAGNELVQPKARDCRVESQSLCEGIKSEEKEGCVGVRARHKMVQGAPH